MSELRFIYKSGQYYVELTSGYRVGTLAVNGGKWVFISRGTAFVLNTQACLELHSRLNELNGDNNEPTQAV